jgi:predicted nucleotidyltransferase
MISDTKINQIVKKIVVKYQPEKVILFGSYAWGKPNEDSDIDLFIVKETSERKIDRVREVRNIIWDSGLPIDILVYAPIEIKRRLEEFDDFFIKDISTKGKILYSI